ncbi:Fe-S cluster biogenesis protein NfuA [Saccharomonospora amisosensis]|uniref:Fe-S cluster biogenesis protein NfuA n=1 Tax=Saccharomonospora amisosensis TaxID=1128677 RepID=A0A7X5UNU6_9PSEU|nr:NifU family protein [Saccharomonospora amisosensis]NIJ11435.1 Fe-S cluster biogenesis protein NfuA [Saccharomonospora amisosensis]
MGESQRLDDAEVQRRLARLDEVLDHVERMPGPTAESAVEAVRTLTEVYGEALARVLDTAGAAQAEALCADELLSHLFVLHDIHPGSLADRAERALAYVRPHLERKGGRVELSSIDSGVAHVRLRAAGCGSCSSPEVSPELEQAVRDSVLSLAPELTQVRVVTDSASERSPSLIPVNALLARTATTTGSST